MSKSRALSEICEHFEESFFFAFQETSLKILLSNDRMYYELYLLRKVDFNNYLERYRNWVGSLAANNILKIAGISRESFERFVRFIEENRGVVFYELKQDKADYDENASIFWFDDSDGISYSLKSS
jgi:hypothetical protein